MTIVTDDPAQRVLGLAARQGGMVSRNQTIELGVTDSWLRARISSRQWQRVHRGVYATFTGPVPWHSLCWAAWLRCGEQSALAGATALRLWRDDEPSGVADRPTRIVVAVDSTQRIEIGDDITGIDLWRVANLQEHVHPARRPPRLRYESGVLLSASRARSLERAIGIVADACQQRRTTPARLLAVLRTLPVVMRFRGVLLEILDDVDSGAYSFLEVRYVRRVERPHGLPTGDRQRRVTQGRRVWFRDVEYIAYRVIVELDGRLGHERFRDRARDMDRDNTATRRGKETYRFGYGHMMWGCCGSAQLVAEALRDGGWRGTPRLCGPACTLRW